MAKEEEKDPQETAAKAEAKADKAKAEKKPAKKAEAKAEKKPAKKVEAKAAKKPAKKAEKAKAEKKPAKKAEAKTDKAEKADKAATKEAAAEKVRVLKVHHLRPAPGAKKSKIRVGRGEGSKGKTAGRGTKGTKARNTVPVGFEGGQMPLHMRLPKLRGFSNHRFKVEYQVVNLDRLTELFPEGGEITVEDLVAKGAVRPRKLVKVLGQGEAGAKFDLTVDAWSNSAAQKIEAAGGSLTAR